MVITCESKEFLWLRKYLNNFKDFSISGKWGFKKHLFEFGSKIMESVAIKKPISNVIPN